MEPEPKVTSKSDKLFYRIVIPVLILGFIMTIVFVVVVVFVVMYGAERENWDWEDCGGDFFYVIGCMNKTRFDIVVEEYPEEFEIRYELLSTETDPVSCAYEFNYWSFSMYDEDCYLLEDFWDVDQFVEYEIQVDSSFCDIECKQGYDETGGTCGGLVEGHEMFTIYRYEQIMCASNI